METVLLKKQAHFFVLFFFFAFTTIQAQTGVGINTTNPQEELDVVGDIGVSGAIVPNSQVGAAGQILQMQSGGKMAWVDFSKYENFSQYKWSINGAATWSWPTGVNEVLIEMWGGGGAGGPAGGGGSGAYGVFLIKKTSATDITISVGNKSNNFVNATYSEIDYGSINCRAYAGDDGSLTSPGTGGSGASVNNTSVSYYGIVGQAGKPTKINYQQSSSTTYNEILEYGAGGCSPLRPTTGGSGGLSVFNGVSYTLELASKAGGESGGGGGGSRVLTANSFGGDGSIILYW